MHLSLTIEQTNRIRASLGLKLIPEPQKSVNLGVSKEPVIPVENTESNPKIDYEEIKRDTFSDEIKDVKPDTANWLSRMKQLKSKPDQLARSKENEVDSPIEAANVNPEPSNPEIKSLGNDSQPLSESQPEPQPIEVIPNVPVTTSSKVPQKPQRAIFKPKKIKKSHTFKPSVKPSVPPPKIRDFKQILDENRFGLEVEKSANSKEFINKIKLVNDSEDLETIADLPPSDTQITSQSPLNTHIPANQQPQTTETHENANETPILNSVSETLKFISSSKPSYTNDDRKKSRKEWLDRMYASRSNHLLSKAELEREMQKYSNQDKAEALEMYKQFQLQDRAAEANTLFRDYTPEIRLERFNSTGATINIKQEFKNISGAFHGTSKPK